MALLMQQLIVLQHAALGRTVSETAHQMKLSPHTVKTYRQQLMRRLKVNNMTHAVHIGHTTGILPYDRLPL